MRAVYPVADGRSSTVSETTNLPEFPEGPVETTAVVDLIVDRIYAATDTLRAEGGVDDQDPTTGDVLHSILERLEQLAWMTGAENRHPDDDRASHAGTTTAADTGLDRAGAIANFRRVDRRLSEEERFTPGAIKLHREDATRQRIAF